MSPRGRRRVILLLLLLIIVAFSTFNPQIPETLRLRVSSWQEIVSKRRDSAALLNPVSTASLQGHDISPLPNALSVANHRARTANVGSLHESVNTFKYVYRPPHQSYHDILGLLSREEQLEVERLEKDLYSGDYSQMESCGTWQESYKRLHEAILSGNARQRYLVYQCDGDVNCGGLSDRMLGMVSTFLIALLTDRAWIVNWDKPVPIETVFQSPSINWVYNQSDPRFKRETVYSYNMIQWTREQIDADIIQRNLTTYFPHNVTHVYINRGIIHRLFRSKLYAPILGSMGLRPHSAFSCLADFIFQPIPAARRLITQYAALLRHPSIFSIGIQIRTGDPNMLRPYMDRTSLKQFNSFFSCASQLAQVYASPKQHIVYVVITDSARLRKQVTKYLPDNAHVLITGLSIDHFHRRNNTNSHVNIVDGVQGAIIENSILAKTTYRVISQGGFGKTSSFLSKQLYTTVVLRPPGNKSFRDRSNQRLVHDCTREDAFTA